MALDLFANFERSENSSIFYRLTGDNLTFSLKLSDLNFPDSITSTTYKAQSSLNGAPFSDFVPNVGGYFEGRFALPSTQGLNTISVNVSTTQGVLIDNYVLSAIVLSSYPNANFIAFPSRVIDEQTGQLTNLFFTNYQQSSGVYFYGEGHTETVYLSTSLKNSGEKAIWFVGTSPLDLTNNNTRSTVIPVYSNTSLAPLLTSYVILTSASNREISYPINLLITNESILSSAPILKFNDNTGKQEFYPFFKSTLSADLVSLSPTNTKYTNNIVVKKYPSPPTSLQTELTASDIVLPLTFENETFTNILLNSSVSGMLTETFIGSQWSVLATTTLNDYWFVATPPLSTILAYQFQIGYNTLNDSAILPVFKASTLVPTTLTLAASSYKNVVINQPPYDWLPRTITTVLSAQTSIAQVALVDVYTPNYFHLKDSQVPLFIISRIPSEYTLQSLTITSERSPTTLILSGGALSGTMLFTDVGLADLSAKAVLKNTTRNTNEEVSIVYQDMFEIVYQYDDVQEDFYRSELTPLNLANFREPKLSPNEWVTADNINSIIEKIYNLVEQLNLYSKLYKKKDKFYAWMGTSLTIANPTNPLAPQPIYSWIDLECPGVNVPWSLFECLTSNNVSTTWEYHDCASRPSGPVYSSCLQKYCVEWKWKDRKCNQGSSGVNISWKQSKCNQQYAKKWIFEPCELIQEEEQLNCPRTSWNVSTFDTEQYPVTDCDGLQRCYITDVEPSGVAEDEIVLAFPNELQLVKNDYFGTSVSKRSLADELFAFQNIVAIDSSTDGKLFVLDKNLPRVSVFEIVGSTFRLFSSWGKVGYKNNLQGFNQPNDIHVDQENYIWIADTGNKCIKKFTANGRGLLTLTHTDFDKTPPLSICVDSHLNVHVLTEGTVYTFSHNGVFLTTYKLESNITSVSKINTSHNRELIYITYNLGVVKYFRTGLLYDYVINDYECANKTILTGYNSVAQDRFRNIYITIQDKIFKIPDLMYLVNVQANLPPGLYWDLKDLLIHKEEYIQPWVYLKSFHRLWDNIELLRNSLFYQPQGCKSYIAPYYDKDQLVIGQNEIVTNTTINRLANQLWMNLTPLIEYFDPSCIQHQKVVVSNAIRVIPTPTVAPLDLDFNVFIPTPTPSPSPSPSGTVTPTPSPTPTPSNTSTTPTPSPSPSLSPTPTPSPSPFPSPTPSPTSSPTPTESGTPTPTPTPSPSPSPSGTVTPTPSPTPTPSNTDPTPTPSPSPTPTTTCQAQWPVGQGATITSGLFFGNTSGAERNASNLDPQENITIDYNTIDVGQPMLGIPYFYGGLSNDVDFIIGETLSIVATDNFDGDYRIVNIIGNNVYFACF